MFRALLQQLKTAGRALQYRVWMRRGEPGSCDLSDSGSSESLSAESSVRVDEAIVVTWWERIASQAMKRMRRKRVSVPSLESIEGWATLAVRLLRRSLISGEESEDAQKVADDADLWRWLQRELYPIDFTDASGEVLAEGACVPASSFNREDYGSEFLHRARQKSSQPVPQECYDMLRSPDYSPLPHVDATNTVPNTTGVPLRYRVLCRFPVHAQAGPNQEARGRVSAEADELGAPIWARIREIDRATENLDLDDEVPERSALEHEWWDLCAEHCRGTYIESREILEVRLYSTGVLFAFLNDTFLGSALHFRAMTGPHYGYRCPWRRTAWDPEKRTWTFSLLDFPPTQETFHLMSWDSDVYNFEDFYAYCPFEVPPDDRPFYNHFVLKAQEDTLLRCQYYASLPIAQRLWAVLTRDEMAPAKILVFLDPDDESETSARVPSLVPARTKEDKRRTYNMLKKLCETYPAFNVVRYALEENADSLVYEALRSGKEEAPTEVVVLIPRSDLPVNNWAYPDADEEMEAAADGNEEGESEETDDEAEQDDEDDDRESVSGEEDEEEEGDFVHDSLERTPPTAGPARTGTPRAAEKSTGVPARFTLRELCFCSLTCFVCGCWVGWIVAACMFHPGISSTTDGPAYGRHEMNVGSRATISETPLQRDHDAEGATRSGRAGVAIPGSAETMVVIPASSLPTNN
ncbi:unnamed protein product [Amoebophrya sp. A120]|nr:unnamed protein product [Amoebophrya sp. A120]|eukprot:GSA120T00023796001.1